MAVTSAEPRGSLFAESEHRSEFAQAWRRFSANRIALVGLVMVGRPLLGLTSLTLFLAAYFVVEGAFEIIQGFQIRPMKGWGWVVAGGAISLLLGWMIWRQWPMSGAWAIGTLFGIHLIFSGFSMIGIGGAIREVADDVQAAAG